jgi:predicted permease
VSFLNVSLDFKQDWRLFAFLLGISLLTALLFGLGAALRASRTPPGAVMKAGTRGMTASRARLGFRGALVVSQVALSLVLLFSAMLFTQSLRNLLTDDPGFKTKGVLIAWLDFSRLQIPAERRAAYQRQLLDGIRAVPGIEKAAITNVVPLGGEGWGNSVWVDGRDSTRREDSHFSSVSPDYFDTLQIPILAGRDFNAGDSAGSTRVALVNESFVKKLGLSGNAIGARFWREATPSDPQQLNLIVGVVKDTKYHDIHRPAEPIAYLAQTQDKDTESNMKVLIRSSLPIRDAEQAVRGSLSGVSSAISFQFDGLQDQIGESLMAEKLLATLSGFFGALAVLLTMTGLYGVMAYTVTERRSEIGIRMALGAQRTGIASMILKQAAKLLTAGLVLGAALSLAAASVAGALLYGMKPRDPATLVGAAVLLALVTLAASLIPSLRAAHTNPVDSLRAE